MSLIRGVLLAGKFRTHHELNSMSREDRRNTLIVELSNRTSQSIGHFQAMDDDKLSGVGAVFIFILISRIRTDLELKTMSDDDQRNTLIVEMDIQTRLGINTLQGFSNLELVLIGMGKLDHRDLEVSAYIRGVLLAGKIRTQHELNSMSVEDQRNTLIVELTDHSNQSNFQSFNNFELAGMGAVFVFLLHARIRTKQELKTMSADDQRNTLIVEIDAQTGLGVRLLQRLTNMDLVRLGLGVEQREIFTHPVPFQIPALRIHFKSLLAISDALRSFITIQFEAMHELFATGQVQTALGTIEDLSGDATLTLLLNLQVGDCLLGNSTNADQNQLFQNRNGAATDDVVVYIVSTLTSTTGNPIGCSTFPVGQPGCVITVNNAEWLTAHEVAHVLGVRHVCEVPACTAGQSDNLMFPNVGWTNTPPNLSQAEFATMINSNLTPIT